MNYIYIIISCVFLNFIYSEYYEVDIEETGVSSLHILTNSITGLEIGDEIGLFDTNAITNYNDCSNEIGTLLLASITWTGSQNNITSIGSVDLCPFGGVQLAGYIETNPVIIRVYRSSTNTEYNTEITYGIGTGVYGDIIQTIIDIQLGDSIISGCMELSSCNYNPNATVDDGSCAFEYDCTGECGGTAVIDECGICEGLGPIENYDCNGNCIVEIDCFGECGGTAIVDCSGSCDGNAMIDSHGTCCELSEMGCDFICNSGATVDCTGSYCGFPEDINWTNIDCFNVCDGTAEEDCFGECGGDAEYDICGICEGSGPEENYDCDGNCIVEIDCFGECGGDADFDECGICGGDGSSCAGCSDGFVDNCDGSGECCPESWIGDGYADCEDQQWGCDLTCYDNDGGDCSDNGSDGGTTGGTDGGGDNFLDYNQDIQPIFNANCTSYCHSGGGAYTGGIDLTSYENLMEGGHSGPAVYPYYSQGSLIIQKLLGTAPGDQMPQGQDPLEQYLIDIIALWIDQGALPPDTDAGDDGGSDPEPLGELSFGVIDSINQTIEILMDCQYPVSAFDIQVSGIVIESAFGGDASNFEFEINTTDSSIIGQSSGENSLIPEHNGLLTILEYSEVTDSIICFEYSNITTYVGIEYEAILGECIEAPLSLGYETVEIPLHYGSNLISFYALPENTYIGNIMSSLEGNINGVIGEGVAANVLPNGSWVGGLIDIHETSGYWVKVINEDTLRIDNAIPIPNNITYYLHEGTNLISFPSNSTINISEAIPDEVEGHFTGIIGEGVAANVLPNGNWVGGLTHFQGGDGYWVKVDSDINFSFNIDETQSRVYMNDSNNIESYQEYDYMQSTKQAFYFIKNIMLDKEPINTGDLILVYNNNVLVGLREWSGEYTDIPAMGFDGSSETDGYLLEGDRPVIKVVKNSGKQYIVSNIPEWSNNGLFTLDIVYSDLIANNLFIHNIYPNPFNPSTTIEFFVLEDSQVEVSVYNLNGQIIENLVNKYYNSGFHQLKWEAFDSPSGVYIVRVKNETNISTEKIILLK